MIKKATPVVVLAALFVLASLAPVLTGCGSNKREKTIKTSFVAFKAAHAGFVEWDTGRQDKIVEATTSFEEGQTKLKAYREGQTKIYAAIALGLKLLLDAMMSDDDKGLSEAIRQAAKIIEQIDAFKEGF